MIAFVLQCPEEELAGLAQRYSYGGDGALTTVGRTAQSRGYFTRSEFLLLCEWKTRGRQRHRYTRNSELEISDATRQAFAASDERTRIEALAGLCGVAYPVASVFLHFAHTDPYPILDRRALQALGVPSRQYDLAFWLAYCRHCRSLARRNRLTMRELDRALWQHSKEAGVPLD